MTALKYLFVLCALVAAISANHDDETNAMELSEGDVDVDTVRVQRDIVQMGRGISNRHQQQQQRQQARAFPSKGLRGQRQRQQSRAFPNKGLRGQSQRQQSRAFPNKGLQRQQGRKGDTFNWNINTSDKKKKSKKSSEEEEEESSEEKKPKGKKPKKG